MTSERGLTVAEHEARPLVLDSWAVLAHFQGDSAGAPVADLISRALRHGQPAAISVVSVGEVWHAVALAASVAEADDALTEMRRWGMEFVDVDWLLTRSAIGFRLKANLSFADAYAAALAFRRQASLLTGSPVFKPLEDEIKIAWLV